MLYVSTTHYLANWYGIEKSVDILIKSGFTGIDFSMFDIKELPFTDNYKEMAEKLRKKADEAGVKFVQAHAPFSSKTDYYMNELVPLMPRAIEFASLLGIDKIVIHPRQNGRYYGRDPGRTLFFLVRPSDDWARPTHILEHNLLSSKNFI